MDISTWQEQTADITYDDTRIRMELILNKRQIIASEK